jgi:hypothetical protein
MDEDADMTGFSSQGGLKRVTDGIVMWSRAFPYLDEVNLYICEQ